MVILHLIAVGCSAAFMLSYQTTEHDIQDSNDCCIYCHQIFKSHINCSVYFWQIYPCDWIFHLFGNEVLFLNHITFSAGCNYCSDVLQQWCSRLCSWYYSNTYFTFSQLDLQYLKPKGTDNFPKCVFFLMERTSVLCFLPEFAL